MNKFLAAFAFFFLLMGYAPAAMAECNSGLTTSCETVTDQNYGGGGSNPTVVPIQACLTRELYQSIQLADQSSAWEVGFYYGNGEPEVVRTVRNQQCWTHSDSGAIQNGHPGSYVVAFICCDYYCGWVGGVIGNDGRATLQPIMLSERHDPMRAYRTAQTGQTGQYDRSQVLK